MPPDQATLDAWSGAARSWEKHRALIHRMFAPVTQALIDDALVHPRHAVLDIATGPGEPALSIAELVGPEGRVVGIDPVPEMVAAARRHSASLGLLNTQFDVADADRLPFPDDTFDAVVSRFGVMFIASPLDAVREMLRVLKPGRKLALAVWHFPDRNPFLDIPQRCIARYIDPPPLAPDAPDTFRFARPGSLRDILSAAGAKAPSERLLQFVMDTPIAATAYWSLRSELSETIRQKIAMLSHDQLAAVQREVLDAVTGYATEHGLGFPAEVLIVSGTKPPTR